ncbi:hypothetical protein Godav_010427 [Gossypium davidsonii]|uniref:Thaumatin-like protein n=1 Tax=Gossypium davidsonii TaxID=34287 RepID=A0A7J8SGJ1_GOSDV|nr:hypothetical protein [Gossypium davidsonii]
MSNIDDNYLVQYPNLMPGTKAATFTLSNNCPSTVWPGILTSSGPPLSTTGFELPSKASSVLSVPATWSGRIWARTQCTNVNGKFQCQTGDCPSGQVPCNGAGGIPPVTLAEFTLAPNNGKDFFDISLVEALTCLFRSPHNQPMVQAPMVASSPAIAHVWPSINLSIAALALLAPRKHARRLITPISLRANALRLTGMLMMISLLWSHALVELITLSPFVLED